MGFFTRAIPDPYMAALIFHVAFIFSKLTQEAKNPCGIFSSGITRPQEQNF